MRDFLNLIGWPDSPGLMAANITGIALLPTLLLAILIFG